MALIALVWNSHLYLYTLRILRYFSLGYALTYMTTYIALLIMFVTVVLEGNTWTHADLWTIMFSMFSGYMLVNAGPGAIVNGFVILKELTLN